MAHARKTCSSMINTQRRGRKGGGRKRGRKKNTVPPLSCARKGERNKKKGGKRGDRGAAAARNKDRERGRREEGRKEEKERLHSLSSRPEDEEVWSGLTHKLRFGKEWWVGGKKEGKREKKGLTRYLHVQTAKKKKEAP